MSTLLSYISKTLSCYQSTHHHTSPYQSTIISFLNQIDMLKFGINVVHSLVYCNDSCILVSNFNSKSVFFSNRYVLESFYCDFNIEQEITIKFLQIQILSSHATSYLLTQAFKRIEDELCQCFHLTRKWFYISKFDINLSLTRQQRREMFSHTMKLIWG